MLIGFHLLIRSTDMIPCVKHIYSLTTYFKKLYILTLLICYETNKLLFMKLILRVEKMK